MRWRGHAVERTRCCGEDMLWRGRDVKRTAVEMTRTCCGEDMLWSGHAVERACCGEDMMWRGYAAGRTSCLYDRLCGEDIVCRRHVVVGRTCYGICTHLSTRLWDIFGYAFCDIDRT